jgi:antitoxin component of RelBE/YafQ-DinJ toxin-antitoxin module
MIHGQPQGDHMILDTDIHIRTDKRVKNALLAHAKKKGISFSNYMRLVLDQAARTPFKLRKSRLP